jgi:serine/threonine-protein kinase
LQHAGVSATLAEVDFVCCLRVFGDARCAMSSDLDKRQMGPFELEQRLGVGGMGIVYLARYMKTGQRVAVKVLSPDLMADEKIAKRFEREMDILKKLKHPHIVQYYGGSTSGAQRFYAMELVKGGSLQSLIK